MRNLDIPYLRSVPNMNWLRYAGNPPISYRTYMVWVIARQQSLSVLRLCTILPQFLLRSRPMHPKPRRGVNQADCLVL